MSSLLRLKNCWTSSSDILEGRVSAPMMQRDCEQAGCPLRRSDVRRSWCSPSLSGWSVNLRQLQVLDESPTPQALGDGPARNRICTKNTITPGGHTPVSSSGPLGDSLLVNTDQCGHRAGLSSLCGCERRRSMMCVPSLIPGDAQEGGRLPHVDGRRPKQPCEVPVMLGPGQPEHSHTVPRAAQVTSRSKCRLGNRPCFEPFFTIDLPAFSQRR